MPDIIDIDTGPVISGQASIEAVGEPILELVNVLDPADQIRTSEPTTASSLPDACNLTAVTIPAGGHCFAVLEDVRYRRSHRRGTFSPACGSFIYVYFRDGSLNGRRTRA